MNLENIEPSAWYIVGAHLRQPASLSPTPSLPIPHRHSRWWVKHEPATWSQSGPSHYLLHDTGQVRYTTLWTSLCYSMNHGLGTTWFQRGLSTLIFYDFIIKDLIALLFPGSSHLCDIYTEESKYKAKNANFSKKECPRVFKRTSIRLASYHLTCLPGAKCLRRSS